ncbi:protein STRICTOSIDINE SYNTHASE-LIKE 10-like [Ziziphus jujuba]|uniref:Protein STRICTOSIDINE SYNTHASE-LIKE 10-like n=1 Tax=Ziziphus jujuba TaxID=326968 RepID=A0A6P6G6I3_ZIZJJ|nr:protein STRICTOSIDINE SYNTHASE-LIKE 10-like [Ziziphus jujuba]
MPLFMVYIFQFILLSFPNAILSFEGNSESKIVVLKSFKLSLPPNTTGPESLAFDRSGSGPYTGISDGRVLKYNPKSGTFAEFATVSSNRSRALCDGKSNPALEPMCGRPLGLGFDKYGTLYIADAYFGLLVVGRNGGVATQLATSAGGFPFRFLNALDIDPETGIVYFTDASARFQRRQINEAILNRDMTGRLLSYDPRSKEVRVLLKNLEIAVGVAVSKGGNFVLVSEFLSDRILRLWLKGPKAGASDIFARLPAPDNIKRNPRGEFWVAANIEIAYDRDLLWSAREEEQKQSVPLGIKLSEEGNVLRMVTIDAGKTTEYSVSEVQESNSGLYLGSVINNYVVATLN